MIKRVISGGQIGADQAGLAAAHMCGIEVGGCVPKGYLTQKFYLPGKHPLERLFQKTELEILRDIFQLKEHTSSKYPPRTFQNVRDADGTLRLAKDFHSPGERCTKKAIDAYHKPYFDISRESLDDWSILTRVAKEFIQWVPDNNIQVLNVAGNSDKTSPGLFEAFYPLLLVLLKEVKSEPN